MLNIFSKKLPKQLQNFPSLFGLIDSIKLINRINPLVIDKAGLSSYSRPQTRFRRDDRDADGGSENGFGGGGGGGGRDRSGFDRRPRYNRDNSGFGSGGARGGGGGYGNTYDKRRTFDVKDFQFDRSHGETGTLINRFIRYIAVENCKLEMTNLTANANSTQTSPHTTLKFSQYYPVYEYPQYRKLVEETANDQLSTLIILTYAYRPNADFIQITNVLNILDEECVKRLPNLTINEMLQILYSYYYLIPNKIVKLRFYKLAMERIVQLSTDTTSKSVSGNRNSNHRMKSISHDVDDEEDENVSNSNSSISSSSSSSSNIDQMDRRIELTKFEFLQSAFYLGLWKKNPQSIDLFKQLFNRYFKLYLNELTSMELQIICSVAYKVAIKIPFQPFYERIQKELLENNNMANDSALLINLIKSIRQNRIKSMAVTQKLEEMIQNWANEPKKTKSSSSSQNDIELRGFIHLLAYFSENLHTNSMVNQFFAEQIMNRIEKHCNDVKMESQMNDEQITSNNDLLRTKDLSTFLWASSNLNISNELLNNNHYEQLEAFIIENIYNNKYKYRIDELIDTCLSLWMLNYKSMEIIKYIFNEHSSMNNNTPQQNTIEFDTNFDRTKIESRRKLLHSCIDIECPEYLDNQQIQLARINALDFERKAPKYLIPNKEQTKLFNAYTILMDLMEQPPQEQQPEQPNIIECYYVQQINDLNIPGILIKLSNGKCCTIEVLDKSNTLSDGNTPFGLMALKLRLLKSIANDDHQILLINANGKTFDQLKELIVNKLSQTNTDSEQINEVNENLEESDDDDQQSEVAVAVATTKTTRKPRKKVEKVVI